MEKISIVHARYSCRDYAATPVSDALLRQIAAAGMQAPSARNERPWIFRILRSAEEKAAIARASQYASSCERAPAVILAIADLARISPQSQWWVQDMSACVENMLLEAVRLSLGSVWLGLYPKEDRVQAVAEALRLPPNQIPFAALPVGYPLQEKAAENRFEEERICWPLEKEEL